MTHHRANVDRYIRRETAVSIAINCVLSLLFFILVFGLRGSVPVWGVGGWVFDYVPQSFMIAFMSTLVPGVIARKKLRAGSLASIGKTRFLPRSLWLCAVVLAGTAAALGALIAGTTAWASGLTFIPAPAALGIKLAYGGGLAATITPLGLRATLSHAHPAVSGETA
jgi:hypothetical protein